MRKKSLDLSGNMNVTLKMFKISFVLNLYVIYKYIYV